MKTLLIVEDEKMIRQGIATMAKRCRVPIETILECRNGVEALEILKERQVDVMFTDIRMPKMDGIELVKKTTEFAVKPQIVVVSGFDDFNYAVEMMKSGVRDYLLKPIKREKVEEILAKLDEEIRQEYANEEADIRSLKSQLRYLLLNHDAGKREWERTGQKIAQLLKGVGHFEEGYVIGVGNEVDEIPECFGFVTDGVNGQTVFFLDAENLEEVRESVPEPMHPGFSGIHTDFCQIWNAYTEAKKAREEAFITGADFLEYPYLTASSGDGADEKTFGEKPKNAEDYEVQFVNQFATDRLKDAVRKLENRYFDAKHHPEAYPDLVQMTDRIRAALEENYGKLLEGENTASCKAPLCYGTSDMFLECFREWVTQMKAELQVRFDSDQNHERIQKAVEYIRENYQKDLNMAMVSNYVSMNYSLFSVTFKEYTGVNFVNYLKDIRMEQAKKLLVQTEEKIVDISKMVGYENEKYFMKTFRNVCGVSPSEYRKNGLIH